MVPLHQFDYILAIGFIFAFLDAFMIGANDVANSWATSVSSRSLTLKQAMFLATICEFTGAVACGARVSDTIRGKILNVERFDNDPTLLMLGMACAIVSSSLYLTWATKIGLPVSTTHAIIGGVLGFGVAALGVEGVNWGIKGVSQVFLAWVCAPGIAGGFAAILFTVTKYGVMKRSNPVRAAFFSIPIYFAITSGILTMLIVWKGTPSLGLDNLSTGTVLGCIFGVAAGIATLAGLFLIPYLYLILIKEDWELKWYHVFMGPLLFRRPDPPPMPAGHVLIKDYYEGFALKADEETLSEGVVSSAGSVTGSGNDDIEKIANSEAKIAQASTTVTTASPIASEPKRAALVGPWYKPKNLAILAYRGLMHGVEKDVVKAQSKKSWLSGNPKAMHAAVPHYDNKAEHTYSLLQVMTAMTASFAHGANDVSNAVAPLAAIFLVWNTGTSGTKSPVPIWVLLYGGSALALGLWFYGYNLMRNLGNKITLHSPSRGFSMELGSAITVVLATRLALPVSTTQCISGATVGVGLCAGTWRSINWRMIIWIYGGWIITLPVTAVISGCLMGIIINAPRWGMGVQA